MRTADNQIGFAVERHDGAIGWVAISDVLDTRDLAKQHLDTMERTPGAEYRVNVALGARA